MKKLVAREFIVNGTEKQLDVGDRYSYFEDPETGKYYRPISGFTIEGDEDLSLRFVWVPEE